MLAGKTQNHLCCRGARVFTTHPITEHGRIDTSATNALKDVWVEAHIKREGVRLADILDVLNNEEKSYFIASPANGDVLLGGEADLTEERIMRGLQVHQEKSSWNRYYTITFDPYQGDYVSGDDLDLLHKQYGLVSYQDPKSQIALKPKAHYRIVYVDVGTSMDEIKTTQEPFQALLDAIRGTESLNSLDCSEVLILTPGLELMCQHNQVHRNINPGNIIYLANWCGKILDLSLQ